MIPVSIGVGARLRGGQKFAFQTETIILSNKTIVLTWPVLFLLDDRSRG